MSKFIRSLVSAVLIATTITFVPFSGAMGATHAKVLRAPGNFALTPHGSSISVSFGSIRNASSYTVRVFPHDEAALVYINVHSGDSVTGLSPLTRYRVTLQSIGDGVNYLNSSESRAKSVKTTFLTCADGGTCRLGDIGPGGGVVFYVAPTVFTEFYGPCMSSCRYLEVAPISGPSAWVPGSRYQWSADTSAHVSTGAGIGSGYLNTSLMIMNGSGAGYAAFAARDYQGPAFKTDWSLPSLEEMAELVMASHTLSNITLGCGEYWTSTELDGNAGWARSLQNDSWASQDYETKDQQLCVMPVRAF